MCVYITMTFSDKYFINVRIYYVKRHHIAVRSDKILCCTWGKQKDSHIILGFIKLLNYLWRSKQFGISTNRAYKTCFKEKIEMEKTQTWATLHNQQLICTVCLCSVYSYK